MTGNQKQLWDYMMFYLQGAGRAGKLTTAVALANTVGQAVGLACEANPEWLRQCCRDAWKSAGMDGAGYTALVAEAQDLIKEIQARQLSPGELDDIAAAKIRRAGLN